MPHLLELYLDKKEDVGRIAPALEQLGAHLAPGETTIFLADRHVHAFDFLRDLRSLGVLNQHPMQIREGDDEIYMIGPGGDYEQFD